MSRPGPVISRAVARLPVTRLRLAPFFAARAVIWNPLDMRNAVSVRVFQRAADNRKAAIRAGAAAHGASLWEAEAVRLNAPSPPHKRQGWNRGEQAEE